MRDLHELPRLRESLSNLHLEHGVIEQAQKAIEVIDKTGRTRIPVAALSVLMLGPGTSITHAAIKVLDPYSSWSDVLYPRLVSLWCEEESIWSSRTMACAPCSAIC